MRTVQIRATLMFAALVLASGPSLADTFPGTMCRSEGAATDHWSGLKVNKVPGTGTTAFICPLIHARYSTLTATPLTIRVNYKTSNYTNDSVKFQCFIRTVYANNTAYDSLDLTGLATFFVGEYHTIEGQIHLPIYGSAAMRCHLPNALSGPGDAGIVSYSVL